MVRLAAITTLTGLLVGWFGAALIPPGEFSILIAGLDVIAELAPQLGPLAAVDVLLTAITGPVLARLDGQVAPFLTRSECVRSSSPTRQEVSPNDLG